MEGAMANSHSDAQDIIRRAKEGFGRDLLTPGYSQLISDAEHLAALLKLCDVLPGQSYLDIGTGSGYVAFALARQHPAASVAGIDIVEEAIAAAAQKARETQAHNLRFTSFAGTQLPFDAGAFHGALSRYAFHHFPLPDLSAREIHRVLKPGGWCVISDPLADEGDDVDFVNAFGALRDDGHVRYYREPALVELFGKAGFTIESKFYSAITFPRAMDERYERLLAQTAARILGLYAVRVEGNQVYITAQIMNIRFRKGAGG
jgi:ubiquinone/menaquinone biosynthesis C-methylase UbiE